MARTDRIENPVVREYLYKFVPEKLNQQPLFAKIFGEGFANHMLRANALVVYSNEPVNARGYAGYHNGREKSITFCKSGEDGKLLTPEDIAKDVDLQETAVHEAIHAILDKNEKECKALGIESGTGLLERYQNGTELGRGLNEGFTEWMCEKAGYKTKAYFELTNYIRLFECAIGTSRTMELGKGAIRERFSGLLQITQEEVEILLGKTDQLYAINDRLSTEINLRDILIDKKIQEGNGNSEGLEKVQKKYQDNKGLINAYLKDPQFLAYIREQGKEPSEESLKDYFSKVVEKDRELRDIEVIEIEGFILNRYFIRDLNQVFESKTISKNDFQNVSKIVSLLSTKTWSLPKRIEANRDSYTAINVVEKHNLLADRYLTQIAREDANKYAEGKLNLKDFLENAKQLCGNSFVLKDNFVKEFCRNVAPEYSSDLVKILDRAWDSSDNKTVIEKLMKTSIYKLEPQDPQIDVHTSIVYDDENFFDRFQNEQNTISSPEDEIEFDFTSNFEDGNEYEIAMANFKKIQTEAFEKNPNAKIHIISRTIIVQNGEEKDFYHIYNGEFVPMLVKGKHDLQFEYEEKPKEELALATVPVKVGFFANLVNKFRRKRNEKNNLGKDGVPNYTDDVGKIVFDAHEEPSRIDAYRVEDFEQRMAEKRKRAEKVEQEQTQDEQR